MDSRLTQRVPHGNDRRKYERKEKYNRKSTGIQHTGLAWLYCACFDNTSGVFQDIKKPQLAGLFANTV